MDATTGNHNLSASLEDYLEAIFHIVAEKKAARATDIAQRLSVNPSSVTGALRALAGRGLINYAPYDIITLTDEGRKAAEDVVRRHEVLRDFFLTVLAVPESAAENAACHLEHAVSGPILERFINFIEFVHVCPRGGAEWIRSFARYCDKTRVPEACERCISRCLEEVRQKHAEEKAKGSPCLSLAQLRPGQRAVIVSLNKHGEFTKKIAGMGATPGTIVEMERVAPLGDPIGIKLKGYHLSLRKSDAAAISVKLL